MPSMQEYQEQNKTQHPIVSIIMTTKDRPILLARALESVVTQSYQAWHLFLVNNGGERQSFTQTLKHYQNVFGNRITIIETGDDVPRPAALNMALKKCAGEFIAVHDDDDSWHPKFLAKTVAFLQKAKNKNFIGVRTRFEILYEEIRHNKIFDCGRDDGGWLFVPHLSYSMLHYMNPIPPISMLLRRSVVQAAGFLQESQTPLQAEWDYFLKLVQQGDIATLQQCFAYYHIRLYTLATSPYANRLRTDHYKDMENYTHHNNELIRETLENNPHLSGLFSSLAEINFQLHQRLADLDRKLDRICHKKRPIIQRVKEEWGHFKRKRLKIR